MKKKRIVSAIMAVAMCILVVPMAVCAEDNAVAPKPFVEKEYDFPDKDVVEYWKFLDRFNYDYWINPDMFEYKDVELFGFTKRLCNEYLLNPDESEENRLIYNYAKRHHDMGLAIAKKYNRPTSDAFLGIQKDEMGAYRLYKLSCYDDEQVINITDNIACLTYIDNSYINEDDFWELSFDEQIILAEKIYEETGDLIAGASGFTDNPASMYMDINGKGYNYKDEELDIVDGEIVKVYDTLPKDTDVLTTETLTGDANEDGSVSLADAVLIMQALSNPDDFSLTEQGRLNADFNGDGTITSADALEIQLFTIS